MESKCGHHYSEGQSGKRTSSRLGAGLTIGMQPTRHRDSLALIYFQARG